MQRLDGMKGTMARACSGLARQARLFVAMQWAGMPR